MDNQAYYYSAHHVIRRAANDNTIPKKVLWQRLLAISLLIAPIIAWFLWPQ